MASGGGREHEACCRPAPPSEYTSVGKVECLHGLQTYTHCAPGATAAIIFMTDIFGYDAPLMRKLADKAAAEGFLAVIPDFLAGDPYVATDPANPMADFGTWIVRHQPGASVAVTLAIIKTLKEERGIQKVGTAGFCWGAKLAAELVHEDPTAPAATVMAHPSLVTVDDIKAFAAAKSPLRILCAEHDDLTPIALAEEFKQVLTDSQTDGDVKIFSGVSHGWTIRYDVNDESAVQSAAEAQRDLLDWHRKYLM